MSFLHSDDAKHATILALQSIVIGLIGSLGVIIAGFLLFALARCLCGMIYASTLLVTKMTNTY